MDEVRLDAAEVRALAQRVLESAEMLEEIRWPAVGSADLPDSAVERATATPDLEDRVAAVVASLRTWAAVARSAAAGVQQADDHLAARLWRPR